LLEALGASGAQVAVLSRNAPFAGKADRVFTGDIRDKPFVDQSIREWQPDYIFHLAGTRARVVSQAAFGETLETNLVGTLNLLYAASEIPALERIVIIGTAEEYGHNVAPFEESMRESPVSAYSFSKQCATHLAQLMYRSTGLPVVVLRPSVAYGPGQHSDMFLPALIQALLREERFEMTLGAQTRDFVFVNDLIEAVLRAGHQSGIDGEILNIGSGEPIVISQLVTYVEELMGCADIVNRGALPYRVGEPMEYWLDTAKAKRLLDWVPGTTLENGLRHTIDWYRNAK
jgi:nucleoside-diphosphate-sugar epimerase